MVKGSLKKVSHRKAVKKTEPNGVKPTHSDKHVAPEGSVQPTYSCRINPRTKNIQININIHKLPDKVMNLDIKKKYLHFDTVKHSKKCWLEFSYPGGVECIPDMAVAINTGGLLKIKIPIDKSSIDKALSIALKNKEKMGAKNGEETDGLETMDSAKGKGKGKDKKPGKAPELEKLTKSEEQKRLDILSNPVKPRVATVKTVKRKSNKDPEGIKANTLPKEPTTMKETLLSIAESAVTDVLRTREVLKGRDEEHETKLMEVIQAKQKRLQEKEKKRDELRQAARERRDKMKDKPKGKRR